MSHHLTYCTNIHPGEAWPEVFKSLEYTLEVKRKLGSSEPFGIGLRLSAEAANDLARTQVLKHFQQWLHANNCYVFTMNGFPYGGFHGHVVKAQVHAPDWTTRARVDYTKQLFDILAELLPEGMDGGISTSPLSYKPWFQFDGGRLDEGRKDKATRECYRHIAEVLHHLVDIKNKTGKVLHLDVEPEPDGFLEDSSDFLMFFSDMLEFESGLTEDQVQEHLRFCWDICHSALYNEQPKDVLDTLDAGGIQVGKLQISAAIRAKLTPDTVDDVYRALLPYDEPTYLHQTMLRKGTDTTICFPDLKPALDELRRTQYDELRTHFHVPIYTDSYGVLQSTNDTIIETLQLWHEERFTNHLEIETYTWDVLPDHQRLDLTDSIARELTWVIDKLEG